MKKSGILNPVAAFLGIGGIMLMFKGCADPYWGKDINTTFGVGIGLVFLSAALAIVARARATPGKTAAQSIGTGRVLHVISFPFYLFGVLCALLTFGNKSDEFVQESIFTFLLLGTAVSLSAVAAIKKPKRKDEHSNNVLEDIGSNAPNPQD